MKFKPIKIKLFHLSPNDFNKFDSLRPGSGALGIGAYFSSKNDNAVAHILKQQGKNIRYSSEWEAEISNPFLMGSKIKNPQLSQFSGQKTKLTSEQVEQIFSILSQDHINEKIYQTTFERMTPLINDLRNLEGAELLQNLMAVTSRFTENNSSTLLQKIGYDSIIAKDTNIVMLDLNKINKISSSELSQSAQELFQKTLDDSSKAAISLNTTKPIKVELADNKNDKKIALHVSSNPILENVNVNNEYAQQMAADISSYRYGKHMTGFVNF